MEEQEQANNSLEKIDKNTFDIQNNVQGLRDDLKEIIANTQPEDRKCQKSTKKKPSPE